MKKQIMSIEPSESLALQYLGASVVLQWQLFPDSIRQIILDQASCIGGLPQASNLQDDITGLIRKNQMLAEATHSNAAIE